MKRTITFKKEGIYDVPSFILCENEGLTLDIVAPLARNGVYYFTARHGEETKRNVLAGRMSVEFSPEWLSKGGTEPLFCELELRDRAGVIIYKKYIAEPLEINRVEVGFEYLASIQKLKKENAELKRAVTTLSSDMLELKEEVIKIPERIERAKKEAVIEAAGGDPMGA